MNKLQEPIKNLIYKELNDKLFSEYIYTLSEHFENLNIQLKEELMQKVVLNIYKVLYNNKMKY